MPRIYTRSGDKGQTGLADGSRVPKTDAHVEAYGTVDELNSWIGLVIAQCDEVDIQANLTRIQSELFDIGSQLATIDGTKRDAMPQTTASQVEQLEAWIDGFEQELGPLRVFILPGGHTSAAQLHCARTICRRAERRLVALLEADPSYGDSIPNYMNRLSDLLFVLARVVNHRNGVQETRWEPNVTE